MSAGVDAQIQSLNGLHVQLNGGWTSPVKNCPQIILASWDWGNKVVDEFYGAPRSYSQMHIPIRIQELIQ